MSPLAQALYLVARLYGAKRFVFVANYAVVFGGARESKDSLRSDEGQK